MYQSYHCLSTSRTTCIMSTCLPDQRQRTKESGSHARRKKYGGHREGTIQTGQTSPTRPPVHVHTADFCAFLKQCNGATRYKVHQPLCGCPKVQRLSKMELSLVSDTVDDNGRNLNGLVVLPDSKNKKAVPAVYVCPGTDRNTFDLDPLQTESVLKDKIDPSSLASLKISCASCLLKLQPNGFVCVASSDCGAVDAVRDMARFNAQDKERHHDHADYVCSLPLILLQQCRVARTREQKRLSANDICQQLLAQGVPVEGNFPVKLQHHLLTFLEIVEKRTSKGDHARRETAETLYWMVIVFNDTSGSKDPCWSLDLTGGKRNLSETTFSCAVRETEEESSLHISRQWMQKPSPYTGRNDPCNAYFLLRPPPELDS